MGRPEVVEHADQDGLDARVVQRAGLRGGRLGGHDGDRRRPGGSERARYGEAAEHEPAPMAPPRDRTMRQAVVDGSVVSDPAARWMSDDGPGRVDDVDGGFPQDQIQFAATSVAHASLDDDGCLNERGS